MKRFKRLPDSELEVMLAVWQSAGPIPTGEILKQVGREKSCSLQTVQSTLNRLLDKGFVRCEKIGRLNFYSPLIDAEDYRAKEAATMVERLYENSPAKLFAALVQSEQVDEEELRELRKILEESGR